MTAATVASRIGAGKEWRPVPIEWSEACDRLGKWPGIVGTLIERLNGRWWRWSWSGSLTDLWRHISERWPGWVGRTHFLSAWKALAEAGLVLFVKGEGWVAGAAAAVQKRTAAPRSCTPASRKVQPAARAVSVPAGSPHKGTRARELLVVGDPSPAPTLFLLPPAPLMRCKMPNQPTRPRRPGSMTPNELAQLRAEVYGEPPPPPAPAAPPPPAAWTHRFEALMDAVGKRWEGTNAASMLYLQTGLLPQLEELSNRASDIVWAEAVAVLLAKKGAHPGSVARYLSGILERKLAEAEQAAKPPEPATIYDLTGRGVARGRRPTLAGMINTCNKITADHGNTTTSRPSGQEGASQEEGQGEGARSQGRQGVSAFPGPHAGDVASHHGDHRQRGQRGEPVGPHRQAAPGDGHQLDDDGQANPPHPPVHLRLPPTGSDAVCQAPSDLRHPRVGRS